MGFDAALFAGLIAAAPAPESTAQLYTTPYFEVLGVAAGLPSSAVNKTVQDHDGYLWIGTQDGLARYDGVGFRVYRHDPADPGSLGGNAVGTLLVDRDNRLWCGGEEAGLNLLDGRRTRFARLRHDAHDPASLSADDVWAIAQDASGAIWVGTYSGGLDRLAPDGAGFAHLRHDPANPATISSDNVLGLYGASAGRLWVGSDLGIDVVESGGAIAHVDLGAIAGGGRVNAIAFADAGAGSVLAATRLGLLRIDKDLHASVVAAEGLSDRLVYGVAAGGEPGELWIATRHGLNRRAASGQVTRYLQNPGMPGAFPGDDVFDAMRDREGNLWFSTLEAGVVRLPASWRNFALFRNDPADAASLSANRTQGISVGPDGSVWSVNSDGGIDRLDAATGRVERLAARLAVPDKTLWSVLADAGGRLWVGHTRGVRVYNLQGGTSTDLPADPARADALAPGLVYHIAQDPAGPVWVATYDSAGAVHRIDPATLRVERFGAAAGLRNGEVDQLGFDAAGDLLVASGAGLDRFDAQARRFGAIAGAPAQRVYAFAFAHDGSLWLHVLGALEHYRVAGKSLALIERVDAQRGWPALTLGGLQVDESGSVWVSSPRGLWRYDAGTRSVRAFDGRDGLASSEFNRLALVWRADGAIFGATLAGIVGFLPSRIIENAPSTPPLIDAISVRRDGRDLALDGASGAIELNWNDRDLRIVARALSYANSAANRYQWKLDRIDADWVDTGNRGEREYPQLSPGRYRLSLRAGNAAGKWSAAVAPLELHVASPPWATPLAYAAYALLTLLFVAALFRAYRHRIKRRYALALAEQQRQLAEQSNAAKTEFLATMGHEIRTPMTGVLGMTELLLGTPLDATQRGYAQAIQNSGRMMLRLVNDSLDLARIEAGKLELDAAPFDLHALLGEVAALAAPLAAAKGLQWRTDIAADLPRHVRGDAVRVKQILLNLVNNAVKFTEAGAVALTAARAPEGALRFNVIDTGPGIAESTRARLFQRFEQAEGARRFGGSGLGLAICRELVARMGGTIALDSMPGKGSTFRVELPLADAAMDAAPAADAAGDGDGRRLRVLLVEDDATVAEVLTGLLAARGHATTHAAQGLAALAEFDAADHDLALVDLDLPGVDGLALARLLRAREAQSGRVRMPLIGISARSAGNEEALCLAAGMDAFLRKPITGAALGQTIAAVLIAGTP